MNITEGCFVRLRNDKVHGPVRRGNGGPVTAFVWNDGDLSWTETGKYWGGEETSFLDVIEVLAFAAPQFDMAAMLVRQHEFSERTFGPGLRTAGVVDHIRKELLEIEADPTDLAEWIDVMILALDGAWRTGAAPAEIIAAWEAKQTKNEGREWPDWRTAPADKAIEHVRS